MAGSTPAMESETSMSREETSIMHWLSTMDFFRPNTSDVTGAYSWWSYRFNARKNNAGWRIDYFLVSNRLAPQISSTPIYSDVFGSDHCPVGLEISL